MLGDVDIDTLDLPQVLLNCPPSVLMWELTCCMVMQPLQRSHRAGRVPFLNNLAKVWPAVTKVSWPKDFGVGLDDGIVEAFAANFLWGLSTYRRVVFCDLGEKVPP